MIGRHGSGQCTSPGPESEDHDHEPKTVFFCIGAHKAGTTWLHSVLTRYPDCALPEIKEVHFFDNTHLSGDLQPASIYTKRLALLSRLASSVEQQVLGRLDRPRDAEAEHAHRKSIYADGPAQDRELTRRLNRIIVLVRYLRIRSAQVSRYCDHFLRCEIHFHDGAPSIASGHSYASKKRRPAANEDDIQFDPNEYIQQAIQSADSMSRSDYQRTNRDVGE